MKAIVFNDEDDTSCTYELINDFLVRRKENSIHLDVFQLGFKNGKLEEDAPVGEFNRMKKIKIEQFLEGSKEFSMQAVSKCS